MSDIPHRTIIDANRVVIRGRGCYNCTAYVNDQSARDLWRVHHTARVAEIKARVLSPQATPAEALLTASELAAGLPDHLAAEQAAVLHTPRQDARIKLLQKIDAGVFLGTIGICLKGKAGTDFVCHTHLCESWCGRTGYSVATGGRAQRLDKLADELTAIADDKARKI